VKGAGRKVGGGSKEAWHACFSTQGTPGHKSDFHCTTPSTFKDDSTRETRQKRWELEPLLGATISVFEFRK
jgi:hypothetical protein